MGPKSVDRTGGDRQQLRVEHLDQCWPGGVPGQLLYPFEPFYFGDYLWSTMTRFVEFQGLEGLRRPQGQR